MGAYKPIYTKEYIGKVVAELLASGERDTTQWSTPKGAQLKRKETITLNVTQNEYWAINQIAKKYKMSVADMLKRIIIAFFFKTENCVVDLTHKINQETMKSLFGYAARRVDEDVKKGDRKKRRKKKKEVKQVMVRRRIKVDGKYVVGRQRVKV
jgi:hypothetical protein